MEKRSRMADNGALLTCSMDGCESPVLARGWCSRHYRRWRDHGAPHWLPPWEEPETQFWARVERGPDDACWPWRGTKHRLGYGVFNSAGRSTLSHRYAYELLIGPIPAGLELDHLCRNPPCVNPAHLEAVTHAENIRRGRAPTAINARKTHCKHGHKFTPENTYVHPGGARACRICRRRWDLENKERERMAHDG